MQSLQTQLAEQQDRRREAELAAEPAASADATVAQTDEPAVEDPFSESPVAEAGGPSLDADQASGLETEPAPRNPTPAPHDGRCVRPTISFDLP